MEKKIGVILLAAGSSLRYNGIKLLDFVSGKQMYLHILDKVKMLPLEPKIIVTQYEEIANQAKKEGFHAVINERPEDGISRSIRMGLKEALLLEPSLDALMFSVCDQPYIRQQTIEAVVSAYKVCGKGIICANDGRTMGNPCIFGRAYFTELEQLDGDVGGKRVARQHMEDVFLLQVENPQELVDIDTRIKEETL